MELAGLQERTVTDRDTIAHFVWGHDLFADSGEDEIEDVIDTLTAEWDESQDNYATGAVEDYLEDLEQQGGLEGMLAEATFQSRDKFVLSPGGGSTDISEEEQYTNEEMLKKTKASHFPSHWSLLQIIERYEDNVIGYLEDQGLINKRT